MHPVNILTCDVVKNENARSCIKKYLYNVEKPQKKRERESWKTIQNLGEISNFNYMKMFIRGKRKNQRETRFS